MKIPIVFCGGASDSNLPRKAHLLNVATGRPYCGQHFLRSERVDCDVISPEDYTGSEACSKCLRHKESAIAVEASSGDQKK